MSRGHWRCWGGSMASLRGIATQSLCMPCKVPIWPTSSRICDLGEKKAMKTSTKTHIKHDVSIAEGWWFQKRVICRSSKSCRNCSSIGYGWVEKNSTNSNNIHMEPCSDLLTESNQQSYSIFHLWTTVLVKKKHCIAVTKDLSYCAQETGIESSAFELKQQETI